jgi:hypothetical protein
MQGMVEMEEEEAMPMEEVVEAGEMEAEERMVKEKERKQECPCRRN